jgi:MtN3 and saliva related transmembrane protein
MGAFAMPDVLGYASSAMLLVTISVQIRRQWLADSNEGVSPWLFLGQCAASTGFLIYSLLIDSLPFVITNAVLAAAALVGLWVYFRNRRR